MRGVANSARNDKAKRPPPSWREFAREFPGLPSVQVRQSSVLNYIRNDLRPKAKEADPQPLGIETEAPGPVVENK